MLVSAFPGLAFVSNPTAPYIFAFLLKKTPFSLCSLCSLSLACMCPSGTTSSVAGAGLCSCGPCEAGHYCAGGAQQPSACQCRPGFYSPATDLSTASQCSLDAPACSNYPCTAGHSCAGAAAQPVSCDCAVGTFSGGGQGACDCGPCPLGAHCAGGSMQPASLGAGCAIADEQGTTCLTCFDAGAVPSTTAGGLAACECTAGMASENSTDSEALLCTLAA